MHRVQWQDIALPLILFLTGIVLMGADWIGVLSLDRIANLWPSALVLIGLCASVTGEEPHANSRRSDRV
jgi:hypothetical protein